MSKNRIAAAVIVLANLKQRRAKRKPKRKIWVRDWIAKRNEQGAYNQLMTDLRIGDPDFYKKFLRMAAADFEYLLQLISVKIKKQDTRMRKAITPGERLAVTLRYLATGKLTYLIVPRQQFLVCFVLCRRLL